LESLIPELHDAGKLLDLQAVEGDPSDKRHNFEGINLRFYTAEIPDNPTWQGIKEHHCSREFTLYPQTLETFLLCIADNLASAVSRVKFDVPGRPRYEVLKVWNPKAIVKTAPLLKTKEQINNLFKILTKPSPNQFFQAYGSLLETRPESARPGKNITSLATHAILTGKFYRMLLNKSSEVAALNLKDKPKSFVSKALNEKQNKWKLCVCRCKVKFYQSPFRAKDLNIFDLLYETMETAEKVFSDNIVFSFSDELLLIAEDRRRIEEIFDIFLERGFWLEAVIETKPIGELQARGLDEIISRKIGETIYESLERELQPPLCEICQMFRGTEEIIDESGVIEYLCKKCASIRSRKSKLKKLPNWKNRVAWLKVNLDFDQLLETLHLLYAKYLDSIGIENPFSKSEVRFSLVAEFLKDFKQFLAEVKSLLANEFEEKNIEIVLSNLFCIQLDKLSKIFNILKILDALIDKYFPSFKRVVSPISFSISCADPKFPFFEHWKLVSRSNKGAEVIIVGKGRMLVPLRHVGHLLSYQGRLRRNRRALHRLGEIAEVSEVLAKIALVDKGDRDKKTYALLRELISLGLDYRGLITFAVITGD
jgi:hypothetical protein